MWFAIPVMDWVLSRFKYCNFLIVILAAVVADILNQTQSCSRGEEEEKREEEEEREEERSTRAKPCLMTHAVTHDLVFGLVSLSSLPRRSCLHVFTTGLRNEPLRCSRVWFWSYGEETISTKNTQSSTHSGTMGASECHVCMHDILVEPHTH